MATAVNTVTSLRALTSLPRAWLWLTAPISGLLAIVAGGGLFAEGLYRNTPNLAAQTAGQNFIQDASRFESRSPKYASSREDLLPQR